MFAPPMNSLLRKSDFGGNSRMRIEVVYSKSTPGGGSGDRCSAVNNSLPAELQARGQAIGQLRGEDALLGFLDVVGHAIERNAGERSTAMLIEGEGCSPVSVPRLPDRAWIDEVSLPRSEPHREFNPAFRAVVHGAERAGFSILVNETALDMGMAKEDHRRVSRQFEIVVGRRRIKQIFVLIERRAMHEFHSGQV